MVFHKWFRYYHFCIGFCYVHFLKNYSEYESNCFIGKRKPKKQWKGSQWTLKGILQIGIFLLKYTILDWPNHQIGEDIWLVIHLSSIGAVTVNWRLKLLVSNCQLTGLYCIGPLPAYYIGTCNILGWPALVQKFFIWLIFFKNNFFIQLQSKRLRELRGFALQW